MNRFYLLLLMACLLMACYDKTQPEKTFSIRLEPAVLNLRVTEIGNVKVVLNRIGGFSDAVTVTLSGEKIGLTAAALTIPSGATEGTLSFQTGDTAKIGTSFPTVNAVGGLIAKTETLTLRVAKAIAEATTVILKGNGGSSQLRQGSGTIILEVDGKNLERISTIKLGDLEVILLPGRTSTHLELQTTVGHGANLGAKDLVLTADGGDTTRAGVLTVSPITSGSGGDDTTGAGTRDLPYRSLKNALSLAQAGDTVRLLNGTYNAASGESWPVINAKVLPPNVPIGVRVEGESQIGTRLEGPGAASLTAGLVFAGAGGAGSLTITGFASGLFVTTGTVTINNVVVQTNSYGLGVGGGRVTVNGSEFKANGFGILVVDSSILELSGGSVHDNSEDGLKIGDGAPSLHAKDFELYNNTIGLAAASQAKIILERVKIHDNRDHGLKAVDQTEVKISGGELYANAQAGLWFSGKSLVARSSTIRDNVAFGVYVQSDPIKVDFGNFTEPGQNDIHNNGPNGNTDQIIDVRPDRSALGDPESFTLNATKLNGVVPSADVYPGDGKWPYLNPPFFSILGKNNVIRVY